MNYRQTKILDAKTLSGAGTETIPLNVQDVISRITLQWIVTKTQIAMNSYPHRDITKIELIDGSDVLHSLDGGQNQALCIFDRKCPTMNHGQYINANSQRSLYGIDFGRFLFDKELALDPSRFRNLQLKVSYDSDISDDGVTSGSLEVWADLFDEKVVSPVGFLMSKEIFSRTPPASGYYSTDLPTDYPLRKLLIQGYRSAYEPWYQVSEARLSEDNDKRVPFDVELELYYQLRKAIDTPVEEAVVLEAGDPTGYAYYLQATDYWASLILIGQGATNQAGIGANGRGGYTLLKGGSTQQQGVQRGWLPNHCFQFPFGDEKDLNDWYDVTRLGSLKLRLKAGTGASATGTVAAMLQQLRRY